MAELREFALFFQLGLRVDVVTTDDVERWIQAVLASSAAAEYPATELLWASRMARSTVDELLGEFPGTAGEFVAGRMLMALLRRRLERARIQPKQAVEIGAAVASVGGLSEDEADRFEELTEWFYAASMEPSVDVLELVRDVRALFERYRPYDERLPATL